MVTRWPIFGLGLLAQLAILGVSLVAMKVLAGGAAFLPALNDPVARYIVLPLINSAGQIAMSAGSASIYLELIDRKEGGPQGALLATFD